MANKVYDIVTEKIIEQLEAGTAPWQKPWTSRAPANLVTRKPYQGINSFLLAVACQSSPYWLTYKQAEALGGNVKRGEKSTLVVYWAPVKYKKHNVETGKDDEKRGMILRYYNVFNLDQTEKVRDSKGEYTWNAATNQYDFNARQNNPIEDADAIVAGMPNPPKFEGSQDAFYRPSADVVGMPHRNTFNGSDEYYSTLFHELVHSTGHGSRLNREEVVTTNFFGTEDYSKEELVAELGAAMLCGSIGITRTMNNSASYLASWIKRLKNDKTLIVKAASKAQKAADYIRNTAPVSTEEVPA